MFRDINNPIPTPILSTAALPTPYIDCPIPHSFFLIACVRSTNYIIKICKINKLTVKKSKNFTDKISIKNLTSPYNVNVFGYFAFITITK